MADLRDVSAKTLRDKLATVTSAKAAKRLMCALAYLDGESVDTMSERYGLPRSTIYYWLDRFEQRSLDGAIEDEPRPGRPPKLGEPQRATLETELRQSPTEYGYDADEWSPELVQQHLDQAYGVTYSLGHVRRLLRELGAG